MSGKLQFQPYSEIIFFLTYLGAKKTQIGSFFVIFGCGASYLKDGQGEFNETFRQCVIDIRDDARLFGKRNFLFFSDLGAKTPRKWVVFVIFGCGASDLKDGQREFNETFTQCVIDTRDDARLFGK